MCRDICFGGVDVEQTQICRNFFFMWPTHNQSELASSHDCTNWGCTWLDGHQFFILPLPCANHTSWPNLIFWLFFFWLNLTFPYKLFFVIFFQIQPLPPTYHLAPATKTNSPATLAYFLSYRPIATCPWTYLLT